MTSSSSVSNSNVGAAMLLMLLVLATTSTSEARAAIVGHSHHNKRHQPGLSPMLILDVEPHTGAHTTNQHTAPIPEYYFPIDSGLLNFTCTIKHPSYKYKLTITRETIPNNSLKGTLIDVIDPNEYGLNPAIKDPRFNVEFSEPSGTHPDTARYLRVSLFIRNLKLEDNGIYKCKYSNITKMINVIVQKSATAKDVMLSAKTDKFQLNTPTSVNCRVSDIYPKPKVTFSHSSRDDFADQIAEKDISNTKQNELYLYSFMHTVNFTPKYTDNNQLLNCSVASPIPSSPTITKSLQLAVYGVQIVDEQCSESQVAALGARDFEITCVFFSNPKSSASWETQATEVEKPSGAGAESAGSEPANENGVSVSGGGGGGGDDASAGGVSVLKIFEGDDTPNYSSVVEEYGAANSGLFKATLRIKEVRAEDLKSYTFKLGNFERVIRLDKEGGQVVKELSLVQTSSATTSTALIKRHSHSSYAALFAVAQAALTLTLLGL